MTYNEGKLEEIDMMKKELDRRKKEILEIEQLTKQEKQMNL